MTLEPITCNNCGAALNVPPGANFVTCAYCGSRLAVKRTPSVVYTEVLQQINRLDRRTQQVSADVQQLQLESELEQLDRAWAQERTRYLPPNRDGSVTEPNTRRLFFLTGLEVAAVLVTAYIAFSQFGLIENVFSVPMVVTILLMIVVIGSVMIWTIRIANKYQQAKAAYLARRAAIVQRFQGS